MEPEMRKLMYSPSKQDSNEFHRIRAWHDTFNSYVTGALASAVVYQDAHSTLRRDARRFADKVHGRIDATLCEYCNK